MFDLNNNIEGDKKRINTPQINLLLITPIYPPTPGGGAQYSEYLVNHFSKMDIIQSLEVLTEKNITRECIEKKGNNVTIKRKVSYLYS